MNEIDTMKSILLKVANVAGEANSGRVVPPAVLAHACAEIAASLRAAIASAPLLHAYEAQREALESVERWMSGYGTATQSEMRTAVRKALSL